MLEKKELSFFQSVGEAFLSFVKFIGNKIKTVCYYNIKFFWGIKPPSTNDNVELSNDAIFGNLFEVILNKLGFGKKRKCKYSSFK